MKISNKVDVSDFLTQAEIEALIPAGFQVAYKLIERAANGSNASIQYSGIGFKAKCIIMFATITGEDSVSFGMAISADKQGCQVRIPGYVWLHSAQTIVVIDNAGFEGQAGVLTAIGDDGFTISWTQDGNWNETIDILVICLG